MRAAVETVGDELFTIVHGPEGRRGKLIERIGAPSKTRTCDLLVRSQTLYPTELWARNKPTLESNIGINDRVRSMSHLDHKATSPASVRCYVLTISDTRTPATDTSGIAIAELLEANGHEVAGRAIVRDDPDAIRSAIQEQLDEAAPQVIITTGGTGITSRDSTYEVVSNLLEKRLEGFGELFRMLSYQEIGPSAMFSRACAGTAQGKIVVSLPGSENAVRLAMNKLLLPELGHLVRELSR